MQDFSSWFRRLSYRMAAGMRSFMTGRYGTDRLNTVILLTGVIASVVSAILRGGIVGILLWVLSYAMMILAIFRMLSRNTYRRYEENRKFLQLVARLKDRDNRYYNCPKCRQTVRVPRGKGKIAITCPKCRERFIKKT